jgi:hypothetical protein
VRPSSGRGKKYLLTRTIKNQLRDRAFVVEMQNFVRREQQLHGER